MNALFSLLLLVIFVARVSAAEKAPKGWTKNATLIDRGIAKLFDRFDVDKNDVIDQQDLDKFWGQIQNTTEINKKKQQAQTTFQKYLSQLDTSKDGAVSREEFNTGISSLFPVKNITSLGDLKQFRNLTLCSLVKTARNACPLKKGFFGGLGFRFHDGMCRLGTSALSGYRIEYCVLNAADCTAVAACYGVTLDLGANANNKTDQAVVQQSVTQINKEIKEQLQAIKKRDLVPVVGQNLVKRGAGVWEVFFWTSLVLAGVVMVPTLVLIPFYVILVVVSLNAVDFNRMGKSDSD